MTFSRVLILWTALLIVAASAQQAQKSRPPRRTGGPPETAVPENVALTRDIQYCTGNSKPLLLDLYVPKTPAGPAVAAVVWIHGGGWSGGDKSDNRTAVALASSAFVVAVPNYRLSGEATFPAAIEDCKCAIRFLRANAAKYGVDPNRIGAGGSSAGAHLALLAGTADETAGLEGAGGWPHASSRLRAVASLKGPSDFSVGHKGFEDGAGTAPLRFLGGTLEQVPEVYRKASPVTWVSPGDPPILLIHGTADTTVPFDQALRMQKAYQQAGLHVELVPVEGADHSFRLKNGKPGPMSNREIDARVVDFFRRFLEQN